MKSYVYKAEVFKCYNCESEIWQCDKCKEYFHMGDDVFCLCDGTKHICEICFSLSVKTREGDQSEEGGEK